MKATIDDGVAIGGSFDDTVQFGGVSSVMTTNGSTDAVLAALDSGGVFRWSKHFGDAGQQSIEALTYDKKNEAIVVLGEMSPGTIDLGDGSVTAPDVAAFVAAFHP